MKAALVDFADMSSRVAKILIGQIDSRFFQSFGKLFPAPRFALQMAERGDHILDLMENGSPPDLLILDMEMQDPDAVQICRTVKANPALATIPILILTHGSNPEVQTQAVEAGCDDFLIEPIVPNVLMARVSSLLRIKLLTDELDSAENVLYTLARTIEAKDRYTLGHADRVAGYAMELGRKLGVSGDDIQVLRKGGMLHDIGKLAIPDEILTKPGKFTPDEFNVMKRHPTLGCDICEKLKTIRDALPIIRHHHEKLDGSGYPDGLKGTDIPPTVRIVTIVDIYDALRSKRSYKDAFSIDKTFQIMWEEVEKGWWDKDIISTWEKIVRARSADPFPSL